MYATYTPEERRAKAIALATSNVTKRRYKQQLRNAQYKLECHQENLKEVLECLVDAQKRVKILESIEWDKAREVVDKVETHNRNERNRRREMLMNFAPNAKRLRAELALDPNAFDRLQPNSGEILDYSTAIDSVRNNRMDT